MKTEILKISSPEDHQAIQKAAKMLDAGSLVALPTETVYGIGCKADARSFERLDEVKGRSPDKRYTLHIGSPQQLEKYVPLMNARAGKLVKNTFPGPVTVVFELNDKALKEVRKDLPESIFVSLYKDTTLGVRYPACPVTCAVLAAAQFPIVAPSANPSGLAPATTAGEVYSYFNGKIESIVEIPDFSLDFKQSSTVVKMGPRDVQILREGAVPVSLIKEWTTIRILFVCTGNTCRSPMAEAFCRKYFADNLGCQVDELEQFGYIIDSAGVAACEGLPASRYAVQACGEQKIDLSGHQSHQLTPEDIEQYDMIFTMARHHRDMIVDLVPSADARCFVLSQTADIADPIGSGLEVYRFCLQQISDCIREKKELQCE